MAIATIVLAAGLGTRMKSETAKVLHRICGRALVEYPVTLAQQISSERVILVLGHQAEKVEAQVVARFGPGAAQVAIQAEQRGTGHAVQQALPSLNGFNGQVLILYGDTPLLTRAAVEALLSAARGRPLALIATRPAVPTGYGRLVRGDGGRLLRVVEERDCTPEERRITEVNAGFYVADAAFLREALTTLRPSSASGELYLTDIIAFAAQRSLVGVVEVPFEEVQGINDRLDLSRAESVMRRRIVEGHMRAGVTLRDPYTSYIDADVIIGADTELGPGVVLRGRTRIGARCHIEAGCVLTDVLVGEGCHLKPYTVAAESVIGNAAHLGPFSHLRPGTELERDVHIGNFVELKKTHVGVGSKANHLSYLGDAEIGSRVNVGCGTITCNYDGYVKSRTIIEDGAFIGSDTQLVAPVRVGADAVVGAGTTVTQDVPSGALALTRAPQVHKEGYAARKREVMAKVKEKSDKIKAIPQVTKPLKK